MKLELKLKYKISLFLFFIEIIVLNSMNSNGIKIQSGIGCVLGIILFFSPLQYLLYSLSKDELCSARKRKYFKIFFWFLNYCIISSVIGTIMLGIK